MIKRLILTPGLMAAVVATVIATAHPAHAQDKGSLHPRPLPPLANPDDPHLAACGWGTDGGSP